MPELTDVTGARVRLDRPPARLVSLVPSTTETVYALGGQKMLVGLTRFCVHPRAARSEKTVIGGTKSPRIERIRSLRPDLVLANKEENREEDVRALREFTSVYVACPKDVETAVGDIERLGILLGRGDRGRELAREAHERLTTLRTATRERDRFRYLYLIWRNPYMAAGPDTLIDALLREAGGDNAVSSAADRYPELSQSGIAGAEVNVILLSSEPYPFRAEHAEVLRKKLGEDQRDSVLLVDGELLSWHGSRLLEGIPYAGQIAEQARALKRKKTQRRDAETQSE